MIRATKVVAGGAWSGTADETVVLEFDERHRRRMVMTSVRGLEFLLDLPEALMLRGGDALELEDGRRVEVVAAPEALVEVKSGAPDAFARLAWHLGNRHLPTQILPKALRIRRDHVIEDMLRGLGAKLVPIEAPFDPEGGAYASATAETASPNHDSHAHHDHHHHDHHHGHSHKHDH
ncbi:urease accessory protein UreE [Lichenifustis flavocetrariae]|uniref:Urease accessory protein UreE n=1 Tax=Lichenifustis flavocetrariae TaxID=2949735 RepID=A0AA41YZF2_9HYPH|nr:urease accessory protein UreE [Lichenifustis flavocetrariae]MCW6507703.1 urease accessory protein UreE [Lichenifustis flavocetrariae]